MARVTDTPLPVDFKDDGRVGFSANGRVVTLRRVTLGEWRTLREAFYALTDDIADATDQALKDGEGADRSTVNKLARELREFSEAEREKWIGQVFGLLADSEVAPEDYEPWMVSADFLALLTNHLQQVPLARGGPST